MIPSAVGICCTHNQTLRFVGYVQRSQKSWNGHLSIIAQRSFRLHRSRRTDRETYHSDLARSNSECCVPRDRGVPWQMVRCVSATYALIGSVNEISFRGRLDLSASRFSRLLGGQLELQLVGVFIRDGYGQPGGDDARVFHRQIVS